MFRRRKRERESETLAASLLLPACDDDVIVHLAFMII